MVFCNLFSKIQYFFLYRLNLAVYLDISINNVKLKNHCNYLERLHMASEMLLGAVIHCAQFWLHSRLVYSPPS